MSIPEPFSRVTAGMTIKATVTTSASAASKTVALCQRLSCLRFLTYSENLSFLSFSITESLLPDAIQQCRTRQAAKA